MKEEIWERLEWRASYHFTERLKVPGGWLVSIMRDSGTTHAAWNHTVIFIKDENHFWDIRENN